MGLSILMVGNSLTAANAMPSMLASLLDAQVVAITRGGARLAEFSNPLTKTGSRVLQALESDGTQEEYGCFDYVIAQDMSHLPATNPSAHERAVAKMCELARDHNAAPVLYGTWGYREGSAKLKKLGMSAAQMGQLMHEGPLRALLPMAPSLSTWQKSWRRWRTPIGFTQPTACTPRPPGRSLLPKRLQTRCVASQSQLHAARLRPR